MERFYFDIRKQSDMKSIINSYNVLNLDAYDFFKYYDYDLLLDFYEPDLPIIEMIVKKDGVEFWHTKKEDAYTITDFNIFLRELKLKRIIK